jgi:Phosphotransferase enzyme family
MAPLPKTAEVEQRIKRDPLLHGADLVLVRKYRVKYSEVLEYQHRLDTGKPSVLVKHRHGIVSPEKTLESLEREYRGLEAVWRRAGSLLNGRVPKPLAYLPEVLAIVFEKLPGKNLETLMKWEGNWAIGSFRLPKFRMLASEIGKWLRCYHNATVQPLDVYDPSVYLRGVLKSVNRCLEGGMDPQFAQELLDCTTRASDRARGKEIQTAASHGDLIPINVLVHHGKVAVVDFGGYREREPIYEDLGMFLAYLGLIGDSRFYSRRLTEEMARAFLAGYASPLSSEFSNLYTWKAALDIVACQFSPTKGSFVRSAKLRRLQAYLSKQSWRLLPSHVKESRYAPLEPDAYQVPFVRK